MKKILSVKNAAEAHLLVEMLQQEGIVASVQGEWGSFEDPSVWIEDDTDFERANSLIAEMTGNHRPSQTTEGRRTHYRAFVGGLLMGLLLGAGVTRVVTTRLAERSQNVTADAWDGNGDGRPDAWARYDPAGRVVESVEDRNFDGVPDSWLTYDPPGMLKKARYDQDFDRQDDYWEVYEKGLPISYTGDDDRNGVVDEWGRFEGAEQVERNWSFSNDRIVDKRAFYRAGRKIREEYDRNRDGVVDETILFDAFERQILRR